MRGGLSDVQRPDVKNPPADARIQLIIIRSLFLPLFNYTVSSLSLCIPGMALYIYLQFVYRSAIYVKYVHLYNNFAYKIVWTLRTRLRKICLLFFSHLQVLRTITLLSFFSLKV